MITHANLAAAVFIIATRLAFAGGGDDHSHAAPPGAATQAAPAPGQPLASQRLSDGSLFIPKPIQRQLGLRSQIAKTETLPVVLTFNGRVIADPNASGRVQAIQSGRIEPGPKGLPTLGQRVRRGEVLAWLKASASSLERGNQQALLAELDAQFAIAERRVRRLEQLEGAVPQKEIEAAQFELTALKKRRSAIGASLAAPEPLLAPASGVISSTLVVAGQVVEARELLFEVIDPARLAVEALAYDMQLGALIGQLDGRPMAASAQATGGSVGLQFIGASRQLREQAMPLLFRVLVRRGKEADAGLAIGQPVKVTANTTRKINGIAVPQSALVKNAAGETVVWLHTGAERYAARPVTASPLSAESALISAGLHDGDRVVTTGANLLAQMR